MPEKVVDNTPELFVRKQAKLRNRGARKVQPIEIGYGFGYLLPAFPKRKQGSDKRADAGSTDHGWHQPKTVKRLEHSYMCGAQHSPAAQCQSQLLPL